jgi:hypothetical protein
MGSDPVKTPDPRVLIGAGVAIAVLGFLLIHPYAPTLGPIENAMIGNIPLGDFKLPYRYVLVFATFAMGCGFYQLKAPTLSRR